MSTAVTPPPSEVVVPPAPPVTKPAAKAEARQDAPTAQRTDAVKPAVGPLSEAHLIREVEHDYVPTSRLEEMQLKTGELRRKPKPEAEVKAEEVAADLNADPKQQKPRIPVDDEKGFDETDLKGQTLPKPIREALDKRNFQIREERRQRKEAEAKLAELSGKTAEYEKLQKELEDLRKAPKIDPETEARLKEYEALKAKYEEAETYLAQTSIERTERFKREITAPLQAVEKEALAIAKKYDLPEQQVLAALRNMGEDRAEVISELVADMKPYDVTEFTTAAVAYKQIEAHKQTLLSDARAHLAELEESERAAIERQQNEHRQRTEAQQAEWNKAVPVKWESILKTAGITEIDGQDQWNHTLSKGREFVERGSFHELPVESQVDVMSRAAVHPLLLGKIKALESSLDQYKAELDKYVQTIPGAGEGSRVNGERDDADDRSKGNMTEAVVRRAREAGFITS